MLSRPATTPTTTPRPPSRVVDAARFYARTLPPFALIVLQMFVMYAVVARVVPHVACRGMSNEVGRRGVGREGWRAAAPRRAHAAPGRGASGPSPPLSSGRL